MACVHQFAAVSLILLLPCLLNVAVDAKTLKRDVKALNEIKASLGWRVVYAWVGDDPCGDGDLPAWSGVTCSTQGDYRVVTELEVYAVSIIGPFPTAVTNLLDLTRLDLHNNKLTGPIPPQIGRLKRLKVLIRCSCCLRAPMGNCRTRGGVVRGKRDSGVPNETVFLIEVHLLIGCCVLIFSKSLHFAQWLLSFGNTKWLYCCSKDAWKYTTMKHDEYSLSYLSKSLLRFSHHHKSRHIYFFGLQMDFHDTGSGPSSWINRGLWFHYFLNEKWKSLCRSMQKEEKHEHPHVPSI